MEKYFATTEEIVPLDFNALATTLFFATALSVRGKLYRIREIEFYLHSSACPDPYVHCRSAQRERGTWYWHAYANGTYKSGTYKGLDITMGTEDSYCGILIRSISCDNETIEGPCRSVNRVLADCGLSTVKELVQGKSLACLANETEVILVDYDWPEEAIYVGPRIGLRDTTAPAFRELPFRYVAGVGVRKERKKLQMLP